MAECACCLMSRLEEACCVSGLCRQYSELISAAIATGGPHIARSSAVKLMRAVRALLQTCTCTWESG